MEEQTTEDRYEKIRKKYLLPTLEELNKDFGVELCIEDPILPNIIEKIIDEIADNSKTLESLIFVNQSGSISEFYERNMVKNREKLFESYKDLMKMYWKAREIKIKSEEREMAEFIKKTHKKWDHEIKPLFIGLATEFNKKWDSMKLKNSETNIKYYG